MKELRVARYRRGRACAAKRKQPPRFVGGESAHARLPGAGCARAPGPNSPEHPSLDAAFQDLVTAQQPSVAPQLPTGGEPMKALADPAQGTLNAHRRLHAASHRV